MRYSFDNLKAEFAKNWDCCVIDEKARPKLDSIWLQIKANKNHYLLVQEFTKIPWYFIACLHYRESSLSFYGVLHNGEKIIGTGEKTSLVPKGRGPFNSWHEAAIDALTMDGVSSVKNWTIERMLYEAERFNGFGYRKTNELSPYVWAYTTIHDETGKYVYDGRYNPDAIEKQAGVAAILKRCVLDLGSPPYESATPSEDGKETSPIVEEPKQYASQGIIKRAKQFFRNIWMRLF